METLLHQGRGLIRWCLQRELVVLPKSTCRERIAENAAVCDFDDISIHVMRPS